MDDGVAERSGLRRVIVEWFQAAALAAIVFALVWLSVTLTRSSGRVATIWPANAMVLACLLRTDLRRWPLFVVAGLIGNASGGLLYGDQPMVGVGLALCNTLEILICAISLRWLVGRRIDLSRPKSLLAFGALAVLAAPIISGLLATAILALRTGAPVGPTFITWAVADALGLLVFAPALITLTPAVLKRLAAGPAGRVNIALLAGFVAILAGVFSQSRLPIQAVILPMLIVLAFQMELAGAALGSLLVAVLSTGFLLAGRGPWFHPGVDLARMTFMLQFNLSMVAATALAIGAALAERRRDKNQLKVSLLEAERAGAAALEASSRARMAEQIAKVAYWRFEVDDGSLTWSEEMYRVYGLDPSLPPPDLDAAMDVVHPDDRDDAYRLLAGAIGDGREYLGQARMRRSDGAWRHVINRAVCERGPSGAVTAVVGALHDVTDLKLADDALRESEARYRLLADHSSDVIIRVDRDDVIRYASPSCRRYGYEPEELTGATGADLVHPDDHPHMLDAARRLYAAAPEVTENREYRLRAKNGDWIWIEGSASVVRDEDGAAVEIISQLRDVGQRKAMEADLRAARDAAEAAATAKSEFLANMSHEIRTPLTSIMGFSSLLREIDGLPANARHYLDRISTAGQSLLSVVNDILDFSKLEAGQVQLDPQPFHPAHFIEDTVELFAVKAQDKGLSLRTAVAVDMPARVEADASRMRQVMLNLIGNALKFTAAGGVTIEASYDRETEKLRIAISDTGAGVPEDRRDRLFQRFSQVDGSISRVHGGTGLGLAISKNLVDLMGGDIGVETCVGEGSTFWFTVQAPVVEAGPAALAEAPASEASYVGRACRILLVDDVAANRELVRAMLSPFGHAFEEADNGADAVALAMQAPFDLILMDLQMPGMDGFAAARAIRATADLNRTTPILAISANVLTEHLDACWAAGMDDHVAKPLQPMDLLLKVARWTSDAAERATA